MAIPLFSGCVLGDPHLFCHDFLSLFSYTYSINVDVVFLKLLIIQKSQQLDQKNYSQSERCKHS